MSWTYTRKKAKVKTFCVTSLGGQNEVWCQFCHGDDLRLCNICLTLWSRTPLPVVTTCPTKLLSLPMSNYVTSPLADVNSCNAEPVATANCGMIEDGNTSYRETAEKSKSYWLYVVPKTKQTS